MQYHSQCTRCWFPCHHLFLKFLLLCLINVVIKKKCCHAWYQSCQYGTKICIFGSCVYLLLCQNELQYALYINPSRTIASKLWLLLIIPNSKFPILLYHCWNRSNLYIISWTFLITPIAHVAPCHGYGQYSTKVRSVLVILRVYLT